MSFIALLTFFCPSQSTDQESLFPRRPGTVWAWGDEKRRLTAEVWDLKEVRGKACVRLRMWGSPKTRVWDADDVYLVERDGALLVAGYRADGLDYLAEEPPALLPKDRSAAGPWAARFTSGSTESGEFRWRDFAFRLGGRERLVLPAGSFEAWKVRWTDRDDPDAGYDLWICPGKGVVRIASLFKKDEGPWTVDLRRLDLTRPGRLERYPELLADQRARIDGHVRSLADSDPERRAEGEKSLRDLGPGVIPLLRPRVGSEKDPEVRGRLETLVRSFSKLRVEARAVRRTSPAGEPLPVQFFLVNDGPEPLLVLPAISDATMNMGRKYPAISVVVTDEAGEKQSVPLTGSFWSAPPLRGVQFRRLAAGEALDLFAEGDGTSHPMLGFRPSNPGRYTVRLAYDVRGQGAQDWATDSGPPDEEAKALLPFLPKGLFESPPVTLTVTDGK